VSHECILTQNEYRFQAASRICRKANPALI
jgi:hypothetical protein